MKKTGPWLLEGLLDVPFDEISPFSKNNSPEVPRKNFGTVSRVSKTIVIHRSTWSQRSFLRTARLESVRRKGGFLGNVFIFHGVALCGRIHILWMFPKIGVGPPKWMVYNGKPY